MLPEVRSEMQRLNEQNRSQEQTQPTQNLSEARDNAMAGAQKAEQQASNTPSHEPIQSHEPSR